MGEAFKVRALSPTKLNFFIVWLRLRTEDMLAGNKEKPEDERDRGAKTKADAIQIQPS